MSFAAHDGIMTRLSEACENLSAKLTLLQFDTKVRRVDRFEDDYDSLRSLPLEGAGGTDLADVQRYAREAGYSRVFIVTDGHFELPKSSKTKMILIIHGRDDLHRLYELERDDTRVYVL
jgi:predicted metal-dependent peptidase